MDFYDEFAPFYHLMFQDWDTSIARQGQALGGFIRSAWPKAQTVLDVSCGIGTQSIALAREGFQVTASDLSARSVERAKAEAGKRGLEISFSVGDTRQAFSHHGGGFDLVISGDNSLPHLLTDEAIQLALTQMHACLKDGGGCLVTVRDYDREERGQNIVKPYGVRLSDGNRYLLFQVWDFAGEHYDFTMFVVEENRATHEVRTHAMRSRYYAIGTQKLVTLMQQAGFHDVQRVDDVFYQPMIVGTR